MTNIIKTITTAIITALFCFNANAQKLATLEVTLSSATAGLDVPASTNLDKITFLPDSVLSLVEIQGSKLVPVPYQIENKGTRKIFWLVKGNTGQKRIFELVNGKPVISAGHIKAVVNDTALNITAYNRSLLRYNTSPHKLVFPQLKAETLARSGYIHPLYAPRGQALTRIDAWDHKHHMGLFNPWTHVLFERDTIDFWNLYKKEGTVRFANFTSVNDGGIYADYEVLHQHVVLKKNGTEKIAMNEIQSVRIYQPQNGQDYYLMDITIHLNAATASPVTMLKYGYSSLGWRGTEKWNRNNSEVLTSEGKPRKEADGTRARWYLVQGKIDSDSAGAVVMSYPANFNHPEPLRVWPENIFDNGDMYTNFVPNKDRDWVIEPGRDYVLKYRFVVFNGRFDKVKSEAAWQNFAHPPVVNVKLNK
ncbi:MAG: hypothetical protein EOP51_20415 [Sphingobacteriales bacterium]|nr:MAG: hypothetical protein EOP51_20415 [Sphingobacteriales bacterium]